MNTLEETVLATEIGSGHTAKQVGTEPRELAISHAPGLAEHKCVGYAGKRYLGDSMGQIL